MTAIGGVPNDGDEPACSPLAAASLPVDLHRVEITGPGLFEPGAAGPLRGGLTGLSGVAQVIANPVTERVVVLFNPAAIGVDDIIGSLGTAGPRHDRLLARWHFRVAGLACPRCARRVEETLGVIPGVRAAIVNRTAESLTVEFVPGRTDLTAVQAALLAQGFSTS